MRDTGASVRRLTDDPGEDFAGGYSRDGRFISFSSPRDSTFGNPDIFRMRADGTQETNLTRTPTVVEFDPSWQPAEATEPHSGRREARHKGSLGGLASCRRSSDR